MKEISENKQHADEAAPAKHREHYGNNGNGSFNIAKRSKTERIIRAGQHQFPQFLPVI